MHRRQLRRRIVDVQIALNERGHDGRPRVAWRVVLCGHTSHIPASLMINAACVACTQRLPAHRAALV